MNKLSFSIETDAPYSQAEIEQLKEDFISFVLEGDGDADPDTAEVSISDTDESSSDESSDDVEISDRVKLEIVREFLAKAKFQVTLNISDDLLGYETVLD